MTEPVKTEVLLKGKLKMNFLSQKQFDEATKNPNELYYVPDSTESDISAAIASHNNNQSSHPYILEQLGNKISKYSALPSAEEHIGEIVEYVGETTEDYTNGYFYKAISETTPGELQVAGTSSSTLMPDDITIDSNVWSAEVTTAGTYVFNYDGTNWSLDNTVVDLATYGITIDSGATVSPNDNFEIVYTPEETTYSWVRVDVQPATDVSGKVDKTNEASKVYGTDENGDQTTYDVNDFGQIDNVAIHGIDQTITDKRVDLKVVEQLYEMPDVTEELFGRVVQYLGEDTEDYTFGYFYKAGIDTDPTNIEGTATATITNTETFLNKVNRVSSIAGTDIGSSVVILGDSSSAYKIKWYDTQGSEVSIISQYPVTTFETETGIKVEGTVDENTRITFETVPRWKQLNTQHPSTVFRRIVEE